MTLLPQVQDLTPSAAVWLAPLRPGAVVYCEGQFAGLDGKTAHGLVRHCEAFEIRAVIDSHCAGLDAGMVLDGVANGVAIVADLAEALAMPGSSLNTFIYGMAPANGLYAAEDRSSIRSQSAMCGAPPSSRI
ncbi:hypothetical protein [Cyanobium sp. WAJ14-Wanaka]|uniref:hypothetical protein n=1 Tax=Cyanobium sp. WAJ14-Wanaka TaxID=2823725 RepID=UPI0020CC897F|nr:hypothetical protein [Cyanobium sp. WAJ14-Wanaka]